MPKREIHFLHSGASSSPPHIRELHSYICDGSEGIIEFDGHYYLSNGSETPLYLQSSKSLPTKEIIFTQLLSDTPKYVTRAPHPYQPLELVPSHSSQNIEYVSYDVLEENLYLIEIYRRKIVECTDQISTIEDEDGEEMKVCFFPTARQRLYFRVLETNPSGARLSELRDILENEEKKRLDLYYATQRASYRGVTIDRQTQSN
jgi:hypothetical protein